MHKAYNGPWRLAHRGVTQCAPENTMAAFERAYELGAEGLEIDIRMSRDGQIVVLHDDTPLRMTTGSAKPCERPVEALDWEELASLELPYANHLLDNWRPEGYPNEGEALNIPRQLGEDLAFPMHEAVLADPRMTRVARLETLLAWMDGLERRLILEIEYKAPGMMPTLCRLLAGCEKRADCIIFSGDLPLIEEIQEYACAQPLPAGVKLGANIRWLDENWKDRIPSMRLYEVGLNADRLRREDVEWLRAQGILTFSNLGDYPEGWRNIVACGAAGFKTNYVEAYTGWWQARPAD